MFKRLWWYEKSFPVMRPSAKALWTSDLKGGGLQNEQILGHFCIEKPRTFWCVCVCVGFVCGGRPGTWQTTCLLCPYLLPFALAFPSWSTLSWSSSLPELTEPQPYSRSKASCIQVRKHGLGKFEGIFLGAVPSTSFLACLIIVIQAASFLLGLWHW